MARVDANQSVYRLSCLGRCGPHHDDIHSFRDRCPDFSSQASQGTFEFRRNDRNQAQPGETVKDGSNCRSGCPKGEEAQEDEC